MFRAFKYPLLALLVSLLCQSLLCMAHPVDSVDALARLKGYARNVYSFNNVLPQEKVYLHFDNTSYFRGETIWFKAYVIRTDSSCYTNLSRVLYVELVAPTGDVLLSRKLKIENGQARGEFSLDGLAVADGWYEIRAYTRYMTNWGNAGIFSRMFPIMRKLNLEDRRLWRGFGKEFVDKPYADKFKELYDLGFLTHLQDFIRTEEEYQAAVAAKKNRSERKKASGDILSAGFYLEGGRLVAGLPSRVAFSLTVREDTEKVGRTGVLLSAAGDTLGVVTTDDEGRGVFVYSPDRPAVRLAFADSDGRVQDFPLPEASESGCVGLVEAVTDSTAVHVSLRCTADMEGRLLGWMIQHEGRVLRFDTLRLSSSSETTRVIPRRDLPAGVNQFTLFDREGRILSDRLFFIHPLAGTDTERILVSAPDTIRPYGRMDFRFRAAPGRTFSFSVTDADLRVADAGRGDVATWLLLSSDVKGFIRRPDRYLESDDREHRAAADRLLMVQGWRRYDWQTMAGGKTFVKRQPLEDGLYIDGQIRMLRGDEEPGRVGLDLLLMHPRKKRLWIGGEALTQPDGWFAFRVEKELEGRWGLVIHTKETFKDKAEQAKNYRVLLNRQFSPAVRVLPWEEKRLLVADALLVPPIEPLYEPFDTMLFTVDKKQHVLREVVVKEKKKRRWSDFSLTEYSLKKEAKLANASLMYYDCAQIADDLLDKGEDLPSATDWLCERPYIKYARGVEQRGLSVVDGAPPPSGGFAMRVSNIGAALNWQRSMYVCVPEEPLEVSGYGLSVSTGSYYQRMDGTYVQGRDVFQPKTVSLSKTDRQNIGSSIFVTIFPRVSIPLKKTGIRQTYFQGYNRPSTFQMNDYSQMEPVDDHRRTLYWNPDVTTDETGAATVTVWNSTSCRRFYLSAEGITPEGKPMMAY
ncbi:MAG: hypothetical protein NC388_08020 [Clostridium sp.]|nr:hypothetical protein [Clostridium sp.]